jgi:hypothetical protein
VKIRKGTAMSNPSQKLLVNLGYTHITPFILNNEFVNVTQVAQKEALPYIAIGHFSKENPPVDRLEIKEVPDTVEYLVSSENPLMIFRRKEGGIFLREYSLPRANGVNWGEHSSNDLVPLYDMPDIIEQAKKIIGGKDFRSIGILLAIKLLDETSGKDLRFIFQDSDREKFNSWLTNLIDDFGLMKDWKEINKPRHDQLVKIILGWQPYRFVDAAQKSGVFNLIIKLLQSPHQPVNYVPVGIIEIVRSFLLKVQGKIFIVDQGFVGLLDLALTDNKNMAVIGRLHPLITRLAQVLIPQFSHIRDPFLKLKESKQYPTLVCWPPFGVRYSEIELIDNFELADRGRGKRSSKTDAEILWIEKSYRLLSDNGLLIILLTDGLLSNASNKFAREWIVERFKIESVISLPISTFRPQSSIKTSLVFLRKSTPPPSEYEINMIELEESDLEDPTNVIQDFRKLA